MIFGRKPAPPTDMDSTNWVRELQRDYITSLIAMLPARDPIVRLASCPLAEQHKALTDMRNDIDADAGDDADMKDAAKFWTEVAPLTEFVPLMNRIEKLLNNLSGDYEYEREAVVDMAKEWLEENAEEYATNAGLAEAEQRLDAIEAVDRAPLRVDEVSTIIDSRMESLPKVDLGPLFDHVRKVEDKLDERLSALEESMTPESSTDESSTVEVQPPRIEVTQDGERETFTITPADAEEHERDLTEQITAAKGSLCKKCGHHPRSNAHADACNNGVRPSGGRPRGEVVPPNAKTGRSVSKDGQALDSPDRGHPDYSDRTDGMAYIIYGPVEIVDSEGTRFWKEREDDHLHLWKAPIPNGPTSLARCSVCGEEREFINEESAVPA